MVASRPLGRWPGLGTPGASIEEGSPIDRWVIILLILLAVLILYRKKIEWSLILKDNIALLFLCVFAGISILWSDFPFLSFKRWIKLLGAIPIAMVVLNEKSPTEAIESVFRRVGYVLVPFSLLFIKYYSYLGRAYGRWSGAEMWIGVTSTKNGLGQLCAIAAFFFIWAFFRDWREKRFAKIRFVKVMDGLVLAIAIFLLKGTGGGYSATSVAVLIAGTVSLLILYRKKDTVKRISMLLVFTSVILWIFMAFSEPFVREVTKILGRDETLTGRTEMWQLLIEAGARKPILGTGYGGYFGTPGNEFFEVQGGSVVGHNGLLDSYVELGLVGVILVLIFHMGFYVRFLREINRSFEWGIFGICFLVMALLFNFTESLFLRSQTYIWNITIFLSVIFSAPDLQKNKIKCFKRNGNTK